MDQALAELRPWAVLNAAGFSDIDLAEEHPRACRRAHTLGPITLAQACARQGSRLVTFSSGQVFDGAKQMPYLESDRSRPLNTLGRAQEEAEARIAEILAETLIVRTGPLFGPWHQSHFPGLVLQTLIEGHSVMAPDDQIISATYIPHLANTVLDLLIDGEAGIWHLANEGAMGSGRSWRAAWPPVPV